MIILLTTANFPDVMLPAYNKNYFYAWLFVIYLIVGLFLLLNMLLAKVFSNYKKQLEERAGVNSDNRNQSLERYFEVIDKGNKGYLTIDEAKKFFSIALELKYTRKRDQITFRRIVKIMDPENTKMIRKQMIIDYFSIPGFFKTARIKELQALIEQETSDPQDMNRSVVLQD